MYSFTQSTLYSQNLIHKEKITHMWLLRLTTGKLYASPPPSALFTSGITNLFSTNVGFINVLSKRHYGIRILGFITTSGALRFIHSCQICFRNAMGHGVSKFSPIQWPLAFLNQNVVSVNVVLLNI